MEDNGEGRKEEEHNYKRVGSKRREEKRESGEVARVDRSECEDNENEESRRGKGDGGGGVGGGTKWEVMEKKKKLRGRKERIDADLTWKERKTRWKLRKIARMEEKKEKEHGQETGK